MRVLLMLLLLSAGLNLWGAALPEWMIPLREAIFEHKLTADEITPLYRDARNAAPVHLSGTALDLALSRCELLMGQAYLDEDRNGDARPHFAEGLSLAEKAQKAENSAEAWLLMSENISRLAQIGPLTFTMANGLSVEKWAKNVLALEPRNAAAQRLIASRWVFAPGPLGNPKKGIEMMMAILENGDMEREDYFNVYSAIGYGYIQLRKPADARPWLLRALEIYPTNRFANGLLAKT